MCVAPPVHVPRPECSFGQGRVRGLRTGRSHISQIPWPATWRYAGIFFSHANAFRAMGHLCSLTVDHDATQCAVCPTTCFGLFVITC